MTDDATDPTQAALRHIGTELLEIARAAATETVRSRGYWALSESADPNLEGLDFPADTAARWGIQAVDARRQGEPSAWWLHCRTVGPLQAIFERFGLAPGFEVRIDGSDDPLEIFDERGTRLLAASRIATPREPLTAQDCHDLGEAIVRYRAARQAGAGGQ